MTQHWLKATLPIAALYAFRMLGLFMLIPVFTILAPDLSYATPTLIGVALGAYGLSQGILQMPFGLLSDKWGRKPLLTLGLLLLVGGSLLGAYTTSIYGMIIARILQGGGAIGSVLMATLADTVDEAPRTKAMAIIGMTIGISFSVALVISPIISSYYGLKGLFLFTTLLAFLGLAIVAFVLPSLPNPTHSNTSILLIKQIWKNKTLQQLNFGIFCQHFILTTTFYAIPLLLRQFIQQSALTSTWQFYLPIMLGAFILMMPLIIIGEKKKKSDFVFSIAIAMTLLSQGLLSVFFSHWLAFVGTVFVYFIMFNYLEANLPSKISKKAPSEAKGTAMGIYSSFQFLGIFLGGVSSGLCYSHFNVHGIFIMNMMIAGAWFFINGLKPLVNASPQ